MNDEGSFEQAMRLAAKRRLENAPKAKTTEATLASAKTSNIAQEHKTMTAVSTAKTAAPKSPKAAKTTSTNGAAPKPESTLTKPQVRILQALAAAKRPLAKADVAKAASVAESWVVGFVRQACKANKTPSLTEQKMVKAVEIGGDDVKAEWVYEITATGRKALERELKNAAK